MIMGLLTHGFHPRIQHCFFRMRQHRTLVRTSVMILLLLLYCEWLHYFVVLLCCTWPQLPNSGAGDLKIMFLADTHLLGYQEGHWFDKLRREWQMKRAFQTSMVLHRPNVVFVLGDLLDEGKWCSDEEFGDHVDRFNSFFAVPKGTQRHLVVGNHDIGFHYMATLHKRVRFDEAFGSNSVALLNIQGLLFVLLNSMAMEGDNCSLCKETQQSLRKVSKQLQCAKLSGTEFSRQNCNDYDAFQYSKPILLQHFPLFRPSDANCSTVDAAPLSERNKPFVPKYDTLSKEASDELFKLVEPRLVIGAHSHHGCYRLHDNKVPEWTVSSFNWRNKPNPSFLMARISSTDHIEQLCEMPNERTVIFIYLVGAFLILCSLCLPLRSSKVGKLS